MASSLLIDLRRRNLNEERFAIVGRDSEKMCTMAINKQRHTAQIAKPFLIQIIFQVILEGFEKTQDVVGTRKYDVLQPVSNCKSMNTPDSLCTISPGQFA